MKKGFSHQCDCFLHVLGLHKIGLLGGGEDLHEISKEVYIFKPFQKKLSNAIIMYSPKSNLENNDLEDMQEKTYGLV